MRKGILLILSFFFLSLSSYQCQNLEKGFEALRQYDYFKAKSIFSKNFKKCPCESSFGLGRLFLQKQNVFHNLDSAYKYARYADLCWPLLTEKEKLKIQKHKMDSLSIAQLNVELGQAAFTTVSLTDSIDHYKNYIAQYKFHPLYQEAILKRNELEFKRAKKIDTAESYRIFMEMYPDALQISAANALLEDAVFKTETLNKTEQEFASFIDKYPDSPYINEIYSELYARYERFDQPAKYLAFIRKYPKASEVIEAWKNLIQLHLYDFSLASLQEFERLYPNHSLRNTINSYRQFLLDPIYPVMKNGHWGYANAQGELVIPFRFLNAGFFSEGIALVEINKGWTLINHIGRPLNNMIIDDALPTNGGIIIIEKNELYGLVDRRGKLMSKIEFEELGENSNALFSVMKEDQYGYINNRGKVIIPIEYELATDFSEGIAVVMKDGKYGAINSEMKEIIPFAFDWVENFENGIARVRNESLYGFYNSEGIGVVPVTYEVLSKPRNNRILVGIEDKFGYLNLRGEVIIPLDYDVYTGYQKKSTFTDNVAVVYINGKFGLIDTLGRSVLPTKYEDMKDIGDGYVAIKNKNKWEYLSYKTGVNLPVQLDETNRFINQNAIVLKDGFYGLIDTSGQFLIEAEHIALELFNRVQEQFKVKVGDKWGIIKNDGIFPVEPRYDKIEENEMIRLFLEEHFFYYDWKTEKILPTP